MIIVIPRESTEINCANCNHVIYNLATLGIQHQVDCQCGAKVVVDRRVASNSDYPAALDRRRRTDQAAYA